MSHRAIQAVLERVEAMPPASSGAFVVGHGDAGASGDAPSGILFVEHQRVCWTTATGMGRRFRDILRSYSKVPLVKDDLDWLCGRCRNEHLSICETLVREGYVAPGALRSALKQHTAESLLAIAAAHATAEEWPLTWIGRRARGLDAAYAFTGTEVLAAVGASASLRDTSLLIDEQLQGAALAGGSAIAFGLERAGGGDGLVGATEDGSLHVADLAELIEWARAALGASHGWSSLATRAYARGATGGGAVAWRSENLGFAAVGPTAESITGLVTFVEGLGLPMVLSTNLPVLRRLRRDVGSEAAPQSSRQGI